MPDVFVFQPNTASQREPLVWKRIRNCSYGWSHPIVYPEELGLVLRYDGSYTPERRVARGQSLQVWRKAAGGVGVEALPAWGDDRITVLNAGAAGVVEALLCRAGRPLALEPLAPGRQASFAFEPALVLGAGRRIETGAPVRATSAARFYSRLDLRGVRRAGILMTGGGHGPDAEPLRFRLFDVETSRDAHDGGSVG
ncbi:MAG: hypothetical protein GY856_29830 [bacterium]|nr:hypothetical protein [bacterium]